ncbi:hypothetical protein [Deinococcus aquaticus]|uniref:hypothetical protein n=1 Tax=Deinococcus aquaticus TaxID=328692 RepID=UPI003F44F2FC
MTTSGTTTATTKKLLREINKTIRNVQTSAGQVISVGNDIYEVVVFTRTIKAINTTTLNRLEYINRTSGVFVARGSPGKIANRDFSYVVFGESGRLYEIHLGVTIKGFSGVGHEADISIISQAECDSARITGREVDRAGCCLAIECKFYSSNLNLHIGRSLIGYSLEVNGPNLILATNSNGNSISKLLASYKGMRHYIERYTYFNGGWEVFCLSKYMFFPEFDDKPTPNQISKFEKFIRRSIMSAGY